jgi:hypothetical protein
VITRCGEPGKIVSVNVSLPVPNIGVETDTTNIDVPLAVGAPEITPAEERLKPAGRLPAVSDKVKELLGGPAMRVCE